MKKLLCLILCLLLAGCGTEGRGTVPDTQAPAHHSGIREDGTFSEGTLFLGDSLTVLLVSQKLQEEKLLGDALYAAKCGACVTDFFDGPILDSGVGYPGCYTPDFRRMTFSQVVEAAGENVEAVYYLFGTNYSRDTTRQRYQQVLDFILTACPNATVYLQTIPEAADFIPVDRVNEMISDTAEHYREEPRLILLDTHAGIGTRYGSDGVHLTREGLDAWYDTIVEFARENQIPT